MHVYDVVKIPHLDFDLCPTLFAPLGYSPFQSSRYRGIFLRMMHSFGEKAYLRATKLYKEPTTNTEKRAKTPPSLSHLIAGGRAVTAVAVIARRRSAPGHRRRLGTGDGGDRSTGAPDDGRKAARRRRQRRNLDDGGRSRGASGRVRRVLRGSPGSGGGRRPARGGRGGRPAGHGGLGG